MYRDIIENRHICDKRPEDKMTTEEWHNSGLYYCGIAIDKIYFDEQIKLWIATNGEYNCIVNYCPWCGEKLT